jgi:multicomponent Na+:H+ antiporter subunit F
VSVLTSACLAIAAIAAGLDLLRLVRAGSLADRIVALDALLFAIVTALAVHTARTGESTYVEVLAVTALLGFVGTVLVALLIEKRGAQ